MNNLSTLPLRLHRIYRPPPSFLPINNPASQPSEPTITSRPLTTHKPSNLRAQIFEQLSLIHPTLKAEIVTSSTNYEFYAHVLDADEKVRYSSGAQESIKVALEVLLALVEEDVLGLGGVERMKGMELGESDGGEEQREEEVDHEMEVDLGRVVWLKRVQRGLDTCFALGLPPMDPPRSISHLFTKQL